MRGVVKMYCVGAVKRIHLYRNLRELFHYRPDKRYTLLSRYPVYEHGLVLFVVIRHRAVCKQYGRVYIRRVIEMKALICPAGANCKIPALRDKIRYCRADIGRYYSVVILERAVKITRNEHFFKLSQSTSSAQ